ncbi:MAG TPA: DUF763 domain-containing protein [Nitrososphaeraceae archaeon]|nr:DUF763 domain-containing protein [Nitrososphaeraceae archaeon]
MINRSSITLPLHHGHPPQYLLMRMKKLASSISRILIEDHGTGEFLKRLADPLWFQSFGCVLGFDRHSSGLTTVVTGVLQRSVNLHDHGIMIAGGKGRKSISSKEPNSKFGNNCKYDWQKNCRSSLCRQNGGKN